MTTPPDGGPVFPHIDRKVSYSGLSLRDWFAGQAVAGGLGYGLTEGMSWQSIAHDAYAFADAMLKEREDG